MHGQTITRDELEASAAKQREEWREYSSLRLFGDALLHDEANCVAGIHVLRAMDECGCNVLTTIDADVQGCSTSAAMEFCIVCPNGTRWVDEAREESNEAEEAQREMYRRRKAEFEAYKQRVLADLPPKKFIEFNA